MLCSLTHPCASLRLFKGFSRLHPWYWVADSSFTKATMSQSHFQEISSLKLSYESSSITCPSEINLFNFLTVAQELKNPLPNTCWKSSLDFLKFWTKAKTEEAIFPLGNKCKSIFATIFQDFTGTYIVATRSDHFFIFFSV